MYVDDNMINMIKEASTIVMYANIVDVHDMLRMLRMLRMMFPSLVGHDDPASCSIPGRSSVLKSCEEHRGTNLYHEGFKF